MSGASSFVGRAVPLRLADIDTDMIIPKQYLTWLTKRGIGEGLFREARRLPDGSPDPGFPLNQSAYAEATILVAGDNFGTGSSREHAVWALMDAGFRAVISSRFGEIFRANAVKNGLLPVQVTPFELAALFQAAEAGQAFVVDVEGQVLSGGEARVSFALAVVERRRLVDRIDEIAEALASDRLIAAFEGRSPRRVRPAPTPRTLCDKVWDDHVVEARVDGSSLLYIDGHLVHEVSSPLAFEGLRTARRKVRAPGRTLAVVDHNVPTRERHRANANPEGTAQMAALAANAAEHGIEFVGLDDPRQGIVHVIGPELGLTLPGSTIACGDSHAPTHGALGALAFGIGTSEVEHVLATQTLALARPRNLRIRFRGKPPPEISAKDLALAVVGELGVSGGSGYVIEYAGDAIGALSMEGRMTVCNMAIETGARSGMIAVDERTIAYVKGRPRAPAGEAWDAARWRWEGLFSDEDAPFDREVTLDVGRLVPLVTWGTSPEDVVPVSGRVPDPMDIADEVRRAAKMRALAYMALVPGQRIDEIAIDRVFIGSCTNGRIEDLRAAAAILRGRHVREGVKAMVVPGSGPVRRQAEAEGLAATFIAAGFEWREPGCSMCVAMNADTLARGERCASTSNRNFEGRQGAGGRTHLVSPAMAAAAAIAGRFVDIRDLAAGS
ncbi:MAG: 3-isopropylmalate dehydratase large subunit [Rhizobiales bacterium]|nr:3-isopropylmalate dehydratase large subunit [Hyphomicrobiales bacterium]